MTPGLAFGAYMAAAGITLALLAVAVGLHRIAIALERRP